MTRKSCIPDPLLFRTPAIRRLAWMCGAPQLLSSPLKFDLGCQLPVDALARLQHWDANPGEAPSLLSEPPHPRLGLYFERLYECLMTEVLGWEMLAKNLPVRQGGSTLGELDFVLRNPRTGTVEHHELAVKFYLGHRAPEADAALWYGPNATDRLDIKTRHLLRHQCRLTRLPETAAALEALGIDQAPTPRVFMPGYLFYPTGRVLSAPSGVPDDHQRGHWVYLGEAREMNTERWAPLCKPHWLGPHVQADPPDASSTHAALVEVEAYGTPRLFAVLEEDDRAGLWKETRRIFVVAAHWP